MLGHRHRVLVIDDDRGLRDAIEVLLQLEGYGVATAGEGQQALDRLRDGLDPCVILLDVMMPVKDGWQFRREQVQDPNLARIPVILCSGSEDTDEHARALGLTHRLRKPVGYEELLALVAHYCAHERSRPAAQ